MTNLTFTNPTPFAACYAAEACLAKRGFSVGPMQGPDPRGILFGDYDIQKWRNLTAAHKAALHGEMTADSMRYGPVTIRLYASAPAEAVEAFNRVVDVEAA